MTEDEVVFLRDVIDIPESVHAGDFKVELSGGFTDTAARVAEYVVTDQLRGAFGQALDLVRAAVRNGASHAAYLHGSFGSGKSHFLTVLHAVLNNDPAARAKPALARVVAEHDEWLAGRRFLMVPYHLVGAADIDSAILGGYAATVARLHPDSAPPPVYRADALLADARKQRTFFRGDHAEFTRWLGTGAPGGGWHDPNDLEPLEPDPGGWTPSELDRAFTASAGDPARDRLVSALLAGPMASYTRGASGDPRAFLPLDNGLAVISRHARGLGYHGLILFLDELILWLQAHMSEQRFVNDQVSKLVKLIESGDADRPVPIVSFISRQRDLSKLVGEDVTGADVKNLEAQVEYLAGRFDVISLEDRNLPAIISERVLKPRSEQARRLLDDAFSGIVSASATDRDVLIDAQGAIEADWSDFRAVYPLSPALLNVLVVLSGALQRERTGLKLLQEMLHRRRADMTLGELIPLGDLWDVLAEGTGEAFTDRLRREAEAAHRFHAKVRAHLTARYGGPGDPRFVADDRVVKTLLLSALAPEVPAFRRLTGGRLAALNHGSIRSRTVTPGSMVVSRLRALQGEFGELRSEGDADPVFSLHLSDLDTDPLLDAVGDQDTPGARRIWIKDQLWDALGVRDSDAFVSERDVVWRGTRRTVELVFTNVWDPAELPEAQFRPSAPGRVRILLDYPFDVPDRFPSDDAQRVQQLIRDGVTDATVVWLPHFLSAQRSAQLGRLLRIEYLLQRNRLDDHAAHLSGDDRVRVRQQLTAQRDNLTSQLRAVLAQLYGIAAADEASVGARVGDSGHVLTLLGGHAPTLHGGAPFEQNLLALTDGMFDLLYPRHPDFDPNRSRKPVTAAELRTVLGWIGQAMADGRRRVVVDRPQLALVRRIVTPLDVGEVADGPLNVSTEWQRRIDRHAAAQHVTGDYPVEDIRRWIDELGYTGLDRLVSGLVIATYAMLADRAWVQHGTEVDPPALDRIGPGYALRAQRLPTPEEYAAARSRAQVLFGEHAPDLLLGSNVRLLAEKVRARVEQWQPAVADMRAVLHDRAAALGLPAGADRVTTAERAANLLTRLHRRRSDATALLRELAGVSYPVPDPVLARAMSSAQGIADAARAVQWKLIESVRALAGRGDDLAAPAARLLDEVTSAVAANELDRDLAPVLREFTRRAVDLVT
ncbi:MAG TPA: hypothetical protein VFX70_17080, partial [Mycobacteriales bacterium]|nr:hypothetical protein [Mycobacteriales bacterium]